MHQKLEIDSQGKYGLGAKSYFQDISGTDLMKPKLQVIFYFGSMAKTYGHFLTYKIHLKKNGDFLLIPLVGDQKIIFGSAN